MVAERLPIVGSIVLDFSHEIENFSLTRNIAQFPPQHEGLLAVAQGGSAFCQGIVGAPKPQECRRLPLSIADFLPQLQRGFKPFSRLAQEIRRCLGP